MRYLVVTIALVTACTRRVAYITTPDHGTFAQAGTCKDVKLAANQTCTEETVAETGSDGSSGAGVSLLSVLLLGGAGIR